MKKSIGGKKPFHVIFSDQLPTINQMIHILIVDAMEQAKGDFSMASKILGISSKALKKIFIFNSEKLKQVSVKNVQLPLLLKIL